MRGKLRERDETRNYEEKEMERRQKWRETDEKRERKEEEI